MCLCGVANGRLLGDRLLSDGDNVADPGGDVPGSRYTQYGGYVRLLHERHYNGIHRRSDPRHRYRAQQSASQDSPRGHEDGWLQPRETARRPLHSHDLRIHVGVEYRGHSHDGAHHIRRSARIRTGVDT